MTRLTRRKKKKIIQYVVGDGGWVQKGVASGGKDENTSAEKKPVPEHAGTLNRNSGRGEYRN